MLKCDVCVLCPQLTVELSCASHRHNLSYVSNLSYQYEKHHKKHRG